MLFYLIFLKLPNQVILSYQIMFAVFAQAKGQISSAILSFNGLLFPSKCNNRTLDIFQSLPSFYLTSEISKSNLLTRVCFVCLFRTHEINFWNFVILQIRARILTMYADRVDSAAKTSIKDRLNGNSAVDSSRRRQITGKRFYFLFNSVEINSFIPFSLPLLCFHF